MESTLLRDGPVYLVNGTRLKDRYAFLFMDAVLICKVSKTGYIFESGYLIGELEMRNDNLAGMFYGLKRSAYHSQK